MPCYDPYAIPDAIEAGKLEIRRELDERTKMLCEVMRLVEHTTMSGWFELNMSDETLNWWKRHKQWDENRKDK